MILEINSKRLQLDIGTLKQMKSNTGADDPLHALQGLTGFASGECVYLAARQRSNSVMGTPLAKDEILSEMDDLEMSAVANLLNQFTIMVRGENTAPIENNGETDEKKDQLALTS